MQKKRTKLQKAVKLHSNKPFGYYIPIIFIIVIIPLITHGKVIELNNEEANFWIGGTTHYDFYNYYKALAIVISTFFLTLTYEGLFLNNKLPLHKEYRYYIPMLIYLFLVILSTFMAHNKHIAIYGFIEMHQGMFVLISYVVITFIVMNYIRHDIDIKVIVYSFAIIALLEGLLGISQYFGFDLLQSHIGLKLITPKGLNNSILNFKFGKYTIYGTLYNTNFVGSFSALVLPVTTVLYIHETEKHKSIFFGTISLLAFSTWLGCNSRAGYLGIVVALIIGIVIFRKVIKIKYKKIIFLFSGFILIAILFNNVSGGRVFNQFSRLNPSYESDRVKGNQSQIVRFKEVSIDKDKFTIKTSKETLIGRLENSNLTFLDGEGNELNSLKDIEGNIKLSDNKYEEYNFKITANNPSYIKANIYGVSWDIYITSENTFKVVSFNNKLTEPIVAPRVKFFDDKETFASNRGYIWSRTIPMLKNSIIIGYGPDNYPVVFPQEDYVGRFNVGSKGMTNIIIDKPHNMYLQIAINTGVLSLISLMIIWGIYLLDGIKLYYSGNVNTFQEYIGASSFLSVIAYLTAGMFNDSVVSVAPLFWVLLGLGIGINSLIRGKININT